MIRDLDYFKSTDGIFYIVKGDYHPRGKILAYPVFWPDSNGDRYHPLLKQNYQKDTNDTSNNRVISIKKYEFYKYFPSCPLVPTRCISKIYRPRAARHRFLKIKQKSVWHDILWAIHRIGGVPLKDIGIFGSYLIGFYDKLFNIRKDIDYVVYGFDNYLKLKKYISEIIYGLSLGSISDDHIDYEVKKLGSCFNANNNTFDKTLARKWSSIQISPGILTTIRFVYQNNEIPKNPIICDELAKISINGKVVESSGANFMPRVFMVKSAGRTYRIVTYYWIYQSPVRNGDTVEITGIIHNDRKTISINRLDHGIKIIN